MISFHTTIVVIIMQYDQQKKDTVGVTTFESEIINVSSSAKNQPRIESVSRDNIL